LTLSTGPLRLETIDMTPVGSGRPRAAILAALFVAACAAPPSPTAHTAPAPAPAGAADIEAIARARADSARRLYTEADVQFMSGMIHHHAQAIVMSKWAASHGAGPSVSTLASRIINAQQDEIATMQQWLRERGQPVPEATATGMKMVMNGEEHVMLMPGMLTDEQMATLDAARGPDFDRLFLTFMIRHHRGAVSMVKQLFGTPGAAQDQLVFKLASDVNVDQTTEIARMQKMLATLTL
jgi:uncharacterized protein (DUF305 family)